MRQMQAVFCKTFQKTLLRPQLITFRRVQTQSIEAKKQKLIKIKNYLYKKLDKQYYAWYSIARKEVFMDTQLKRGVLEICVLSAMQDKETYGYELVKNISPVIEISESTLYPILRRLESGGFVTVRSAEHNGRLRKYYSITSCGRDRIKDFLQDWQDVIKIGEYITEKYYND